MSRWVSLPDHATDVEGGLPQGFRASGVACGLKPSGGVDMGLLVSDSVGTVSAARFTRSGVLAAPVILCQERCRLDSLRAVVANAGNANAATGRRGSTTPPACRAPPRWRSGSTPRSSRSPRPA